LERLKARLDAGEAARDETAAPVDNGVAVDNNRIEATRSV
jgi:hypothetical protein